MVSEMVTESCNTKRTEFMKEYGSAISGKGRDTKDIRIIINMKETSKMGKLIEKEFIHG